MAVTVEKLQKITKNTPKIVITHDCIDLMNELVAGCSDEIGWLCLSKKEDEDTYLIYDVMMCDQEVQPAYVELLEDSLSDVYTELLKNRPEEVNNCRVWVHSHVNMSPSASGTDDQTFEEYYSECDDYFIRLIMNKKGEYSLDLADIEEGVMYRNLTYYIRYDELMGDLLDKLDEAKAVVDSINKVVEEERKKRSGKKKTLASELIKKHVTHKKVYPTTGYTGYGSKIYSYNSPYSDPYSDYYGSYTEEVVEEAVDFTEVAEAIKTVDAEKYSLFGYFILDTFDFEDFLDALWLSYAEDVKEMKKLIVTLYNLDDSTVSDSFVKSVMAKIEDLALEVEAYGFKLY